MADELVNASPTALEVTFISTRDEASAHLRYLWARYGWWYWVQYWLNTMTLPAVLFVLLIGFEVKRESAYWITGLVAVGWLLRHVAYLQQSASRWVSAAIGGKSAETLRVEEAGFRHISSDYETFIPWRTVCEIKEHGRLIYFFYRPNEAVAVPMRAFGTLEEQMTFVNTANAYWRTAKLGTRSLQKKAGGGSDA